ncbi:MAG: polysaccharide biosynthesis protein [Clostridia bacterium]|nr:polysaccharide biosynthesis protein [Clostridia bacterium]
MKKLHQFLINAILLSGVALLMRSVGVIFQVYIANRVGAEALGLYGLFSGVYGFSITFATSGIHLAATRLTAEALDNSQAPYGIRKGMQKCFLYSLCFGSCAAIGLYSLAPILSLRLLDEIRVLRPLRILAFALLPISLSSAMNGYFTACRRVYKNAVAQVFEQAVRIGATVAVLGLLCRDPDPEKACISLVIGSTVAEISSFLLSLVLYCVDIHRQAKIPTHSNFSVTRKLCGIAMPVAFSSYIRSGLLTLEHALIPQGLRKSGASREDALKSYGILNSMVFPVILFPTALIGSFSGLLVPELAECRAKNNRREISYIAERVYSLALWFSIGTAAVLCCFAEEFGAVIYNNAQAARYIRLLSPLIPVMYLDTTTDAMLKGLGQQVYSMAINIADSLISVILVLLLLPNMGIDGYVLTVYIAELFNTTCSVVRLWNVSDMRPHAVKWVFKPLLCAVGATALTFLTCKLLPDASLTAVSRLCLHVLMTVCLYFLLLCGIHAVEREEFQWIRKVLLGVSKKDPAP